MWYVSAAKWLYTKNQVQLVTGTLGCESGQDLVLRNNMAFWSADHDIWARKMPFGKQLVAFKQTMQIYSPGSTILQEASLYCLLGRW